MPQMTAGEVAGESGDGEPASASDVVRQSSGGLPAGAAVAEAGEGGRVGPLATAVGALPRREDDQPGISADNAGGIVRGKSTTGATVDSTIALGDISGTNISEASRGADSALAANLPSERQAAALPVLAAAPVGAGGLSAQPAVDVGLPSRRARPESDVAHLSSGRLILERSGANRAAEVRVQDVAVPGFRQRDRQFREALARQ
ncbi:MAG: hypothetical protein B7Z73_15140, partial [Planctomycetia bacterium 21-64-5]